MSETKVIAGGMGGLDALTVESAVLPINSLAVEVAEDPRGDRSRRAVDRRTRVVLPDGRRVCVTGRFWTSFSSLFNLGRSTFDYFSHAEVFDRLAQSRCDRVRLCVQSLGDGTPAALSLTNPAKPLLGLDDVRGLLDRWGGTGVGYSEGVLAASFDCPFPTEFRVGSDGFRTRFHLDLPVDGFGLPSAYLSVLRLVCSNGLVGMAPAFKTTFQVGRGDLGMAAVLGRVMETFNNEEGYHVLRQRLEAASGSWASLHEAGRLRKSLQQAALIEGMAGEMRASLLSDFDRAVGDPAGLYGLSGAGEISVRRARAVPVRATVYDLFNLASEAATHRFARRESRVRLDGWIGEALSGEYDLEGTVGKLPEHADFHLRDVQPATATAGIAAAMN